MKKYFIIFFCLAASALLFSNLRGQSLGERIKRSACQKVCERNYNNCMKDSEKKEDGYASDVQDAVKEETCADAKEKCMEKCDNL